MGANKVSAEEININKQVDNVNIKTSEKTNNYSCYYCKKEINTTEIYKYCPYCGRTYDVRFLKIVLNILKWCFIVMFSIAFIIMIYDTYLYINEKKYKNSFIVLLISLSLIALIIILLNIKI